jgi:thiol-disulfide isomerase/thioredoxin
MKRLFFVSFLLFAAIIGHSQRKQYVYDSIVRRYNILHNQPFPKIELEDTSGNLINTASFAGKTVYVDFWFTTCPPCVSEIPYFKALQQEFAKDTNIVFLSICIENVNRKAAWKQMINEKAMPGIHLFYSRNRPQKVNLLRIFDITFPTYLLLNKDLDLIGYDAPRPSQQPFVRWAITQAKANQPLSESFTHFISRSPQYKAFSDKMSME